MVFITFYFCRFLRRAPPPSRTTVYGWGTRVEPVTTTCTRSTVTRLWMVLLNRCTLRWLLVTGSVHTASRSSRLPPFRLSFARGRALNSSTTPKSSSRWSSRRLGRQVGSSRPPTRPLGLTCLFSFVALKINFFMFNFATLVKPFVCSFSMVVGYFVCSEKFSIFWEMNFYLDNLITLLSSVLHI